ncbi:MAG: hypothetical protein E7311_06810 [Clostridiales bacterium]|nr:hypothetical protein [Clostridiales bacterium]
MQFRRIVIATAEIKGLEKGPYYFDHHCFWAWSLRFENPSSLCAFRNLPSIYLSLDKQEASKVCAQFKKAFEKANIHEGDTVALICNTKGDILAIGRTNSDIWVDVYQDRFTVKTFKELKLNISSLKIW